MTADIERRFVSLVSRVQACRKCARMNDSARVIGPGCGPLTAPIVFVGEAPGRLGADGSHLPFHGDKSGHNFESLMGQVGISRYDVFVTNAVLCNPRDEAGNNATPTPDEIRNCSAFLQEQLEIVQPAIVATLGAVALKACALIEPHLMTLSGSVRTSNLWSSRKLIPLYHPGQRAMVHRSFANQLADYQFVAESLRRITKPKRRVKNAGRIDAGDPKLVQITQQILTEQPEGISYFALHKLYFLAEVAHMEAVGERLSNAYVVRQKDGPYFVDLHVAKLQTLLPGIVVERRGGSVRLRLKLQRSFGDAGDGTRLSSAEEATISKTVSRYGHLPEEELKRVVYLSKPMRALLRKEKALHVNLFNAAVLPYQGKQSIR